MKSCLLYTSLPGGCDIGSRPIDLHMKGFRSMGADIEVSEDGLDVEQTVEKMCIRDRPSLIRAQTFQTASYQVAVS